MSILFPGWFPKRRVTNDRFHLLCNVFSFLSKRSRSRSRSRSHWRLNQRSRGWWRSSKWRTRQLVRKHNNFTEKSVYTDYRKHRHLFLVWGLKSGRYQSWQISARFLFYFLIICFSIYYWPYTMIFSNFNWFISFKVIPFNCIAHPFCASFLRD